MLIVEIEAGKRHGWERGWYGGKTRYRLMDARHVKAELEEWDHWYLSAGMVPMSKPGEPGSKEKEIPAWETAWGRRAHGSSRLLLYNKRDTLTL